MKTRHLSTLTSSSRIHVLRLTPGEDLKHSLQRFASAHHIKAAVILTAVGSLAQYNLRFANRQEGIVKRGYFEIISLVGTLSESSAHLHIGLSDDEGTTKGGHLLENNLINTTAEIALAELDELEFSRELDPESGYKELVVSRR